MGNGFAYTLYARPLNLRRGNKVRVYFREFLPQAELERSRGKSFYIDTLVDATIASLELPENLTQKLVEEMNKAAPEGIRFYEQPYDDPRQPTKIVIHAELADRSKETRQSLDKIARDAGIKGRFFLHPQYSGSRDLRYKFPPFTRPVGFGRHTQSKHEGWVLQDHDELPLEPMLQAVMNDVHMYFDFETEGWKSPGEQERIAMAVIGTNKPWLPKYLLTRYDLGVKELRGHHIKFRPSEESFAKAFRAIVRQYDPLSINGFNAATFDLRKGRQLLPDFIIGVDGTTPKVRSATGRFYCTQVHGRCVVDPYNKLQPEYQFLVNQRLPMFIHYLRDELPQSEHFEKSLNYVQLNQAYELAKRGDSKLLREAAEYTIADGDATLPLVMSQLPEVFMHAINLHYRPESICKGFGNIADESWKRAYFALRKTELDRYTKHSEFKHGSWIYIPRMNPHKDQRRFFTPDLRITSESMALPKKEGEFADACFFYPTLLLSAAKPLIDVSEKLRAVREYFRWAQPIKRYRGARRLQEIIVLPVTEYLAACKEYRLNPAEEFPRTIVALGQQQFGVRNHEFAVAYGNGQVDLRQFNKRFADRVQCWQSLFDERQVINSDSQYLILEPGLADRLQREYLGITIARGPAISFGRRAFLYAPGQDTLYVVRSKLMPSRNAEWERSTIHDLLKDALVTVAESGMVNRPIVRDILEGRFEELPQVDKSRLLVKRRVKQGGLELFDLDEETDERALREWYGFADSREVPEAEFLSSSAPPDAMMYRAHLQHAYAEILDFLLLPQQAAQQALSLER